MLRLGKKGVTFFFRHEDGRTVTVPFHKGELIGVGLLLKILRDVGVRRENFIEWLDEKR